MFTRQCRWFALTAIIFVVALTGLSQHPLNAAKPGGGSGGGGGGGGSNTGGGTIYFLSADVGYASMNSDGSGKTPLPVDGGEPSRLLHSGHRWFLQSRFVDGEFYPNGDWRVELYAQRDDGAVVQLTTDPNLQLYGDLHWEPGDVAISWIARRWDIETDEIVDAGIYEAELVFDEDGNITGLAEQPLLPLVPADLIDDYQGFLMPDMGSHDWSPDGTRIVSDRESGEELWLTDLVTAESWRLLQTDWAKAPVWSPDGSKIAFNSNNRGIGTINIDGSNFKNIVSGGPSYSYGGPIWSPTGSHLSFYRYDHGPGDPDFALSVYRSAADGKQKTNLTNDLVTASPRGWR